MLINGNTQIYGIIGHPVSHSFSPAMHTAAFQFIKKNAVYLPFDIPDEKLKEVISSFSLLNVQGFNVTVPYKERIIPYLDIISPEAEKLQSVNTVINSCEGWKGYSTDGLGFVRSIKEKGAVFKGKKVLLLGAGGSAKAIALALAEEKVSVIHIKNRSTEKAYKLIELLRLLHPEQNFSGSPSLSIKYDFLINCTSVGMDGKSCPVEEEFIDISAFIIDIIYNPSKTPLLKLAETKRKPFLNGLSMLLYQGILAFEIWSKQEAPIEVMKKILDKM